ncbi:hypothetical protein RSAG8_05914, partial [Rhizoctonia solani AG-8 WAC10335]
MRQPHSQDNWYESEIPESFQRPLLPGVATNG